MTHGKRTRQTLAVSLPHSGQKRAAVTRIALAIIILLAFGSPIAHAQTYTQQTRYSFTGSHTNDGVVPLASLIAVNGIFYGTTAGGYGTGFYGTVFSFNPATNKETVLYQFTGTKGDGANPYAALLNVNGILYGTTDSGGTSSKGTIFSIDPITHVVKIIHSFSGSDGAYPQSSLINVSGILYGTTYQGGFSNQGTVFAINPSGTGFQLIHSFRGGTVDGQNPVASLTDIHGTLYGTTEQGGTRNDGTVFSIDPVTETEQIVYRFNDAIGDGYFPTSNLIYLNGILYGTTSGGGTNDDSTGTVFAIDPTTGAEAILYSFGTKAGDGAYPEAGLIYDSVSQKLFGTTEGGGIYTNRSSPGSNSSGTVFSLDPITRKEETVYNFNNYSSKTDGINPYSSVIAINGILYGTASGGGAQGDGTLFSLTPAPPIARDDHGNGLYNKPLVIAAPGVLGNDDNDNNPMTAILVTNPSHGTLTLNSNGSFTYAGNTGFVGTDSFKYQAVNTIGKSNIATCTITIQAHVPTAYDDTARIRYNTTLVITAPGVLTNDFNGDPSPMTAALVRTPYYGTLTFNSDGSFKYVPNTGFVGSDSFTYQAVNALGKSNIATCTIAVQATVPTANDDHGRGPRNTGLYINSPGVLTNDNNGGIPITASLVTNPSHGTITFNSDGGFRYLPNTGFVGTDSFTYQAVNSVGKSNIATCTLTIF